MNFSKYYSFHFHTYFHVNDYFKIILHNMFTMFYKPNNNNNNNTNNNSSNTNNNNQRPAVVDM